MDPRSVRVDEMIRYVRDVSSAVQEIGDINTTQSASGPC